MTNFSFCHNVLKGVCCRIKQLKKINFKGVRVPVLDVKIVGVYLCTMYGVLVSRFLAKTRQTNKQMKVRRRIYD